MDHKQERNGMDDAAGVEAIAIEVTSGRIAGLEWLHASDGWWYRRVGEEEWAPMPSRAVMRLTEMLGRIEQ